MISSSTPTRLNRRHKGSEYFPAAVYLLFALITILIFTLCVSVGSVRVPLSETVRIISDALTGKTSDAYAQSSYAIILSVRLPRVCAVALTGASLALCGAAMQGLLKNPLADGSTLGVSSGASLGAAVAIAFDVTLPFTRYSGTTAMAMLFAFLSMILVITLAHRFDRALSTGTIILMGIIFSMFVNSIISLIVTFASDKMRSITFWTMGSLAGSDYKNVLTLGVALILCGAALFREADALNAFAVDEDNARHIGVDVARVRLATLILVSVLIGVCVSIGGAIGFVGLITPHMVRILTGPNHKRLLPASLFTGASFLMLADLVARVLLNPLELPIGVVTSFIGAPVFILIYYHTREGGH